MKVRFFRALGGVCAGTEIFTELQSQSLWRTLWHLLLATFLAAVVCAVGEGARLAGVGRAVAEQLEKQCGGIRISARGLEPLKEPETMREFLLPGMFLVTYLPENRVLTENFPGRSERGALWIPERIGIWSKGKNNTWLLSVVTHDPARFGDIKAVAAPGDLLDELRRSPAMPWRRFGIENAQVFSAEQLRTLWNIFLIAVLPAALFLEILIQVVLYVAMFAVVFWLMSLRRPTRRPLREVIVLAVYAGFPAMLVGALAVALDLPHLDFNWIYVLGMTGYLMTVMNRLERDRRENDRTHE